MGSAANSAWISCLSPTSAPGFLRGIRLFMGLVYRLLLFLHALQFGPAALDRLEQFSEVVLEVGEDLVGGGFGAGPGLAARLFLFLPARPVGPAALDGLEQFSEVVLEVGEDLVGVVFGAEPDLAFAPAGGVHDLGAPRLGAPAGLLSRG